MEHQVGAQLERLLQPRRRERGVHQQRHAGVVRDGRHAGDVQHVQPRIAQRFAEQQLRVRPDRGAPAVDVARLDEGRRYAEARQGIGQQVVRAAVQRGAGDDVRPRPGDGGHGQVQRGLAAGGGDRADAAFQRGHTLLEHGRGRVGDPAVDVAGALHVEQRGGVPARLEHERGGQVDGRGPRAGGGVGRGAGVQREGVEGRVGRAGHGRSRRGVGYR